MIELTETAVDALRSVIETTSTPVVGLRLSAQAGGCSGYQYQMGLVECAEPDSVVLLAGTTIDFVDGLEGSGFSFDNPNAKSTCGCGKSFC
jgi:Fe-S cluster assembly iron-binding protein IscA